MVDIECTRCGATGNDYPTHYVAKFTLKHETGCGAKIGVPKYSTNVKATEVTSTTATEAKEILVKLEPKPKKKKAKNVKQRIIQNLSRKATL